MRNKRTFLFAGLVLGLALVFGITTGAMAGNIRIGVAAPFTGNLAAYGDNIKAGVSLKLKEINDAGGINGQKVELVWGDDLCASPKMRVRLAPNSQRTRALWPSSAICAPLPPWLPCPSTFGQGSPPYLPPLLTRPLAMWARVGFSAIAIQTISRENTWPHTLCQSCWVRTKWPSSMKTMTMPLVSKTPSWQEPGPPA